MFQRTAGDLSEQLVEAAVDHGAFEKGLRVCELVRCRATCCHDGVVLSEEEASVLTQLGGGEGIRRESGGKFRTRVIEASDEQLGENFPDHFRRTRCVFLDEKHRCHWQLRAVEEGRHPWFYKPISCWLHPLLITRRDGRFFLTIRSPEEDKGRFASDTPCGAEVVSGSPARVALGMELKMLGELSGRDFHGELNASPGFSCGVGKGE